MKLVSVILPTYNRAWSLCRAIDSVLNQSYSPLELIIVDDGSTDETKKVLEKYKGVKLFFQANSGVSTARNHGLGQASGQLISFIDSDDEWEVDKIKKQVEYLEHNKDYCWVHSNEKWIRNGKFVNQMKKHTKAGGDQFLRSLELCIISPSSVLMKKVIVDEFKGFREDFPVCEDYDLWLKLTSKYKIGFIDEPLVIKYGGHEDQLSTQYFAMDYYRVNSILWCLNNLDLSPEHKEFAIRAFKDKCEVLIKGYTKHNNREKLKEIKKLLAFVS